MVLICCVAILRSPGISNAFAVMLALGARLLAMPMLANFNLETPVFKFNGQTLQDQLTTQGAAIKKDLVDIKQAL